MPASNSAIEATKRNRAMMHKPYLFETMKRYHKNNGALYSGLQKMTAEEQTIFNSKMEKARKGAMIKEIIFYSITIVLIVAVVFFLLKNF